MADQRYLKKRRQGWYFVMAVPRELRGKPPWDRKTTIVESLKTRDLSLAQKLRWAKVDAWTEAFRKSAGDIPLTRKEINDEAWQVYKDTLSDTETGKLKLDADPQPDPEGLGREASREETAIGLLLELYTEALDASDFKIDTGLDPTIEGPEWLKSGQRVSPIKDELAAVQERTGAVVPEGTETYRLLAEAILRALVAALSGRLAALREQPSEPPTTFVRGGIDRVTLQPIESVARPVPAFIRAPKIRTGEGAGPRVSEAGERFLAERQRDPDASLTAQTAAQVGATFRLFADFSGDARMDAVTRAQAADFLTALGRLHRHYAHRAKPRTPLATLLRDHAAGPGEGLSNRTLNRHQSALATLWRWARKSGLLDDAALNPFADLSRPKAKRREWLPFEASELEKLFDGLAFEMQPERHNVASAQPWVMAIGLYSGMREGEICGMDGAQVKRERGVWFFDITEAKSEAGVRRVPVHSALIGLGLLDYVKAMGQGPLFPGIAPGGPDKKRSHTFTKRFTTYRRTCGVTRARLVFHSFRKCFVRALETAGIDRDRAAQVIGHERGFTFRVYNPEGVDMKELRKVVEAVKYDRLTLA